VEARDYPRAGTKTQGSRRASFRFLRK
jgi:hypothetical protein